MKPVIAFDLVCPECGSTLARYMHKQEFYPLGFRYQHLAMGIGVPCPNEHKIYGVSIGGSSDAGIYTDALKVYEFAYELLHDDRKFPSESKA
jgi:hypothetical protein